MKKQTLYSMSEKLLVENHGGRCCRNFAKNKFWKVEHVIFSRTDQLVGQDITTQKNKIFSL